MTKINYKFKLSYNQIICIAIIIINYTILHTTTLYNALFPHFTYIAAALLILQQLGFKKYDIDLKEFILIVAILSISYINTIINGLAIGEYFELIWFYYLYIMFRRVKYDRYIYSIILSINFLMYSYLTIYSFINKNAFEVILDSSIYNSYNVLRTLNPNQVGLSIVIFHWLLMYFLVDIECFKSVVYFVDIVSAISIYYSRSRSSLAIFVASLLLFKFGKNTIKKNYKLAVMVVVLIIIIGFAFPIGYVACWHKMGFGAKLLGKSLFTGRERIWDRLFSYIQNNPLSLAFGTGKIEDLFWHNKFNYHNSYIAMICMFGAFPLLGYFGFVLSKIKNAYNLKNYMNDKQFCMYILIVVILSFGIVETTLTYILSMIFMILALCFIDKEDDYKYSLFDFKLIH